MREGKLIFFEVHGKNIFKNSWNVFQLVESHPLWIYYLYAQTIIINHTPQSLIKLSLIFLILGPIWKYCNTHIKGNWLPRQIWKFRQRSLCHWDWICSKVKVRENSSWLCLANSITKIRHKFEDPRKDLNVNWITHKFIVLSTTWEFHSLSHLIHILKLPNNNLTTSHCECKSNACFFEWEVALINRWAITTFFMTM